MNNTVILNGLVWDKENLSVNSNIYLNYTEANKEISTLGKRLPTESEFNMLSKLPHVFDFNKRGMWFAERPENLKTENSLFLMAMGYWNCFTGAFNLVGTNGYYWLTPPIPTYGYCLYFDSSGYVNPTDIIHRKIGLSVRCVLDIK